LNNFVDELPHNLKIETSLYLHEDTYNSILFLKDRSDSFIAWICPLLRPLMVGQEDEVFYENKEVNCIYFLKEGSCGFVLSKKYNQAKYIDIPPGCTFGIIDIIGSILLMDEGEVDGDSF
jgi:hypothetical protein